MGLGTEFTSSEFMTYVIYAQYTPFMTYVNMDFIFLILRASFIAGGQSEKTQNGKPPITSL
ncbi:hypothetical protein HMPREF0322_03337 [Desulfitobacterium hafniense DP7]|uniref:Uncharacterized protein n=1 Tax=Desulfitobacterium hafniense DP7 TaxID=537010 RepID=G9XQT8_DESHA|nr:hypothetical protein HMPREF0322_03337 [Desulfitobacterium hafniense DP7]